MGNKPILELIIVLVLVVFALWTLKNSTPAVVDNGGTNPTEDVSGGSTNTNVGGSVKPINYTQALTLYKNARIQLDTNCQASPNNVTYKNGANIMIDNRAPVARTVKIGSTIYIPAYGFKIVKLVSATLPATWYVDCDKSQNVATILIQK